MKYVLSLSVNLNLPREQECFWQNMQTSVICLSTWCDAATLGSSSQGKPSGQTSTINELSKVELKLRGVRLNYTKIRYRKVQGSRPYIQVGRPVLRVAKRKC